MTARRFEAGRTGRLLISTLGLILAASGLGACVHSAVYTARVEDRHPPIGDRVPVDGHDVHVIARGQAGPPVLMIHGASANAREFDWTLAPLLSGDHRVLMADRPGHGYSERPGEAHRLGVQARQMAGVLDTLAPGEPAVVVGHSFGGAVALRLALDHPDKVRALVLSAPVSHDWGGGGAAWYNAWASPPVLGPVFSQLAPVAGPVQVEGGVDSVFHPAPKPEDYYQRSAIGLLFRPGAFRANARDVDALQAELAAQEVRYGELTLPIVVYSGAKDTVIKPQLHVGRLKKQAADVTLVALAHEGHMPHHAEAEAMAHAVARLARGGEAS